MNVRGYLEAASAAAGAFRNWPSVLASIAGERAGLPIRDLRVVTRGGSIIRCPNHPYGRGVLWEIFCGDEYDLDSLAKSAGPGDGLIVDIGAHIGAFTVSLAERLPNATFECFEPSVSTFTYLNENIRRNGLEGRARAHNVAVGASTEPVPFWEHRSGSSLNSRFAGKGGEKIHVNMLAFEALVRGTDRQIDLVKIDCEGGEFDIVLGSQDRSWARIQNVIMEHHPVQDHHVGQLTEAMERRGFSIRKVQNNQRMSGVGLTWFNRR